jgi:hypothetical protein
MAGKLLQEFIVNAWAITEQSCLTFIKLNQAKLYIYHCQEISDAIVADPTVNTPDLGQHIILPSSFSGSTQNMIQHCQDALAVNHYYYRADLFLTATANPNWPEIKDALLPGQKPSDQPDLIDCVFHAKMKELHNDLYKKGIIGHTVARVYTIEISKAWTSSYAYDYLFPPRC